MRLVGDTNVLVSAVLTDGTCRRLLGLASQGKLRWLLSPATSQELLAVLKRPRFKLAPGQAERVLTHDVLPFADVVPAAPLELAFPCRDPHDDKFLACALQGQADFLVTGDKDLLQLAGRYPFKILSPQAALQALT